VAVDGKIGLDEGVTVVGERLGERESRFGICSSVSSACRWYLLFVTMEVKAVA